jgi:hypothetical protein
MNNDIYNNISNAQSLANQNGVIPKGLEGFTVPSTYNADGNGLPYTKVPSKRIGRAQRNIITWFVPEFGIARMYINPQSIAYTHKKIISKERTKGGFSIQYWGEDLSTLNITGTTGTAGIEGINMLYEIYRAEQYAFDSVGLSLEASNAANDLASQGISEIGSSIGGLFGGSGSSIGSGILSGLFGTNSPNNSLASRNIMSLAQLACSVEMYYNGAVYRGFFENMTVNERADNFMLEYQISFVVTQKRGYRYNYFPWSRSAADSPSNDNTPNSYDLNQIIG